jgi:hypothetical protein
MQKCKDDGNRNLKMARKVVFLVPADNLIENVKYFQYLGQILKENDQDWPLIQNGISNGHNKNGAW